MAIAFDASSQGSASATSVTVAHTCTGSNRILITGIWVQDPAGDVVTGVTYNGVAMTQINKSINTATYGSVYLYYLIAPATGTNNVVVTKTGTDLAYAVSASYTGALQSSQPNVQNVGTGSGTSLTVSVTTTVDNCWLVGYCKSAGGTLSAGANTFARQQGPNNAQTYFFDSNAAKTPAGSFSLVASDTGTNAKAFCIAAIAPSLASTNGNFLSFM